MAVPRPVLLAILGLALCAAAFVGVRGVGSGEEDPVAPAAIPSAPTPKAAPQSSARGRAHSRPRTDASKPAPAQPAEQAKPAEQTGKETAPAKPKLSPSQVE